MKLWSILRLITSKSKLRKNQSFSESLWIADCRGSRMSRTLWTGAKSNKLNQKCLGQQMGGEQIRTFDSLQSFHQILTRVRVRRFLQCFWCYTSKSSNHLNTKSKKMLGGILFNRSRLTSRRLWGDASRHLTAKFTTEVRVEGFD